MSQLVTGEFSTRRDAGHAVDELVRAGIPREEIYVESEPPPPIGGARQARTIATAEGERRIAGVQTGMVVGGLSGLFGGLMLATMSYTLAIMGATVGDPTAGLSWPFTSTFWSGTLGLLAGLAVGFGIGAAIDFSLSKLGAGPARPQEECLVTLLTEDPRVELAGAILAHNHARHVLRT